MQSGTINHELFESEGNHRPFDDMQGLAKALGSNGIVWCWGARAWTKMNDFCLRFFVSGRLHTGHVYIAVNGGDLFDVYITTNRGRIKHTATDVYLDVLVDTIDRLVETKTPAHIEA